MNTEAAANLDHYETCDYLDALAADPVLVRLLDRHARPAWADSTAVQYQALACWNALHRLANVIRDPERAEREAAHSVLASSDYLDLVDPEGF